MQYIRLKMFMKELHTALFAAPTGVGKTHLALNLCENEYNNHFNFIVIICLMFWNIMKSTRVEVWFGMILTSSWKSQVINYTN